MTNLKNTNKLFYFIIFAIIIQLYSCVSNSALYNSNKDKILDDSNIDKCAVLHIPPTDKNLRFMSREDRIIKIDNKQFETNDNCIIFLPPGKHVVELERNYYGQIVDRTETTPMIGYGSMRKEFYHYGSFTNDNKISFEFSKRRHYNMIINSINNTSKSFYIESRAHQRNKDVFQILFWPGLAVGLGFLLL